MSPTVTYTPYAKSSKEQTDNVITFAQFEEGNLLTETRNDTDHIFPVLPIKDLINQDGNPKTPHKLATGTKPSVSHLRVLFCPCVVRKATAHVETKTLNMLHQTRKCDTEGFVPVASLCGVFGLPSSFIRSLIGRTGKI